MLVIYCRKSFCMWTRACKLHIFPFGWAWNCSPAFSWPQQWGESHFSMRGAILVLYLKTSELLLWNKRKNTSEFVLKCIWMWPLSLKSKCCVAKPRHASRLHDTVMAKWDVPLDHHGSSFLQEHLCLCYSLWGVKPRHVIAIITHLCSVPPALPTNPAPPAPATWGLQTDVADVFFFARVTATIFLFKWRGCPTELVWPGTEHRWSSVVCGQKMRCELVTSWEGPLGSSGTPTVWSSLKHPWLTDFVPLSAVMVLVRTMFWE